MLFSARLPTPVSACNMLRTKKEIENVVKKSWHKGLKMKNHTFTKGLYGWISYKIKKYGSSMDKFRIYKNHLFIYSRNLTLITVLKVPTDLLENENRKALMLNSKIENFKNRKGRGLNVNI